LVGTTGVCADLDPSNPMTCRDQTPRKSQISRSVGEVGLERTAAPSSLMRGRQTYSQKAIDRFRAGKYHEEPTDITSGAHGSHRRAKRWSGVSTDPRDPKMSELGHFRRSTRVPLWSGEPQRPDVRSLLRHVGVAPKATVRVAPASSGKRSTKTSLRSKAWNTAMPGSRLG
jgi:hypothetical protein